MKRIIFSMFGAGLVILALAATAVAAEPTATPSPSTQIRARETIPAILGLTHEQVMAERQAGKSLAQIAEQQNVDPQVLVDTLMAQWTARIEIRVANGALTQDEATALTTQLETRARDMVYKTTLGGMQGAAVGAGPGAGGGMGMGQGQGNGFGRMGGGNGAANRAANGTCTGTGPVRAGQQ